MTIPRENTQKSSSYDRSVLASIYICEQSPPKEIDIRIITPVAKPKWTVAALNHNQSLWQFHVGGNHGEGLQNAMTVMPDMHRFRSTSQIQWSSRSSQVLWNFRPAAFTISMKVSTSKPGTKRLPKRGWKLPTVNRKSIGWVGRWWDS